jgi:DNA (cytosine-5)-methyltransferase 1
VYRLNHPTTPLDTRDIREVQPDEILEATGLKVGEVDVVEGSPPCASFSTAGKREKHWGQAKRYSDTVQRSDDLFFEYIRLVDGIKPKVFVAENVSGLVKGVAKGYFLEILARLKACGYRVGCKVLDAQWLGVPQARQRTIFIGVREDLGKDPVFPQAAPLPVQPARSCIVRASGTGFAGRDPEQYHRADDHGGRWRWNEHEPVRVGVIHDTRAFPRLGTLPTDHARLWG